MDTTYWHYLHSVLEMLFIPTLKHPGYYHYLCLREGKWGSGSNRNVHKPQFAWLSSSLVCSVGNGEGMLAQTGQNCRWLGARARLRWMGLCHSHPQWLLLSTRLWRRIVSLERTGLVSPCRRIWEDEWRTCSHFTQNSTQQTLHAPWCQGEGLRFQDEKPDSPGTIRSPWFFLWTPRSHLCWYKWDHLV